MFSHQKKNICFLKLHRSFHFQVTGYSPIRNVVHYHSLYADSNTICKLCSKDKQDQPIWSGQGKAQGCGEDAQRQIHTFQVVLFSRPSKLQTGKQSHIAKKTTNRLKNIRLNTLRIFVKVDSGVPSPSCSSGSRQWSRMGRNRSDATSRSWPDPDRLLSTHSSWSNFFEGIWISSILAVFYFWILSEDCEGILTVVRPGLTIFHKSLFWIPRSHFSLFALWCFVLKFSRPTGSFRPLHKNCVPAWTVFCGYTQEDVTNHDQLGPTVIIVSERLGVWPTDELSHQHAELEAELNERLATLSALAEAPVRRLSRLSTEWKATTQRIRPSLGGPIAPQCRLICNASAGAFLIQWVPTDSGTELYVSQCTPNEPQHPTHRPRAGNPIFFVDLMFACVSKVHGFRSLRTISISKGSSFWFACIVNKVVCKLFSC